MHPDHLLGHAAFLAEQPQFVAAATQARALTIRQAGYLARQKSTLGEALTQGTEVILPNHPIKGTERLDLGGRDLIVQSWRTAHTDNDLTIQDSLTHTLFTGDLLFVDHLPVIDGSIKGWLAILPELIGLTQVSGQSAPVVPGHGRDSPREGKQAFEAEQRYLQSVASEVRAALKAHQTLQQAVTATLAPAGWKLTNLYHRRNVTATYAELEWED
jgi:glyoxylase-like metal-dependent hydrolase (beta-lactamase superfamily II)